MKICIFGAGAVGGFLATHLAQSPANEVSVVSRGLTLAHIREKGLRVVLPDRELTARIEASDNPRDLGQQDVVILTVKQHQLDDATERLAPLIGANTMILPPTTGIPHWFFYGMEGPYKDRQLEIVDPEGRHWAAIPPERVIGCVYWIPVVVTAVGVVTLHGQKARCPIGELHGQKSARVLRLAEALKSGGLDAPVSYNIRADIWAKVVSSLCWNSLAVLTQATLGEIARAPDVVELSRRMATEADMIAAALGVKMVESIEQRMNFALAAEHHKMSMLQDLEAGRPLEFDVIHRSIMQMKQLTGLPTPAIDVVLPLMALRAKTVVRRVSANGMV